MDNVFHEMREEAFGLVLNEARLRLRVGDVRSCRTLALSALKAARKTLDLQLEARALLCLANGDRMGSRFRRAHQSSQRAAYLFQLIGDVAGEAEALSTVSYTYSVLGRSEEAVEAALLSLHLSKSLPPGAATALSYNYLGIAYAYGRSSDEADAAFASAIQILRHEGLSAEAWLPCLNRVNAEICRLFYERYYSGKLPGLDRLQSLRADLTEPFDPGAHSGDFQGAYVVNEALWHLISGIDNCWRGLTQAAEHDAERCAACAADYPPHASLTVMEFWLRTEIAWAKKDWKTAEQWVHKMIELAVQAEHEPFITIGHLLAAQVMTDQGHTHQVKNLLQTLRIRKQSLRSEFIKSRSAVVAWHLKVRKSHDDLQRMEASSRELERLSFEDPLTGLPNRRRFAEIVPTLLKERLSRGHTTFVALIDIDQFKQVNDRFSHQVGDRVLQSIAQILKSQVREGDVPARLAGDEFVLAFGHTDALNAQQVCDRLRQTVTDHDWASIQTGLAVSVSIGLAQAYPQDTIDTLTHRADLAMYSAKRQDSPEDDPQSSHLVS